jgi:Domain of unknown function (DUF4910)
MAKRRRRSAVKFVPAFFIWLRMNTRLETLSILRSHVDLEATGSEMLALMAELFPICRSISGAGLRQSLAKLGDFIPLTTTKSRAPHPAGPTRLDPLPHELLRRNLGLCLSHRQLQNLAQGKYEVVIDSTLKDGATTYGECVLPGQSEEELLISTHACHPSLANDNLSGLAVAATLARILAALPLPLRLSLPVPESAFLTPSGTFRHTVTTRGNTARRGSISRWGASAARHMASIPSTTHQPIISNWRRRSILRIHWPRCWKSSTWWRTISAS